MTSVRPRAIVLTSTHLRHHYLVNRAAEALDVVGVWQERKSFEPMQYAESDADGREIARHFAARDASEDAWFGSDGQLRLSERCVHRVTAPGGCNEADERHAMTALLPEIVLVFGTSLLRRPLIEAFAGRVLNLHLGLSPYYRGAGTNFWPLVNGEPEYVGATIHYLDEGVDSGPIVAHARPAIEVADGPHDIGNRTIVAAVDVLLHAAGARQPLPAVPQAGGGRVYRRKDFSADAVRQLYRNFADGMIPEYLADRARRDAALSLVSLPLEG